MVQSKRFLKSQHRSKKYIKLFGKFRRKSCLILQLEEDPISVSPSHLTCSRQIPNIIRCQPCIFTHGEMDWKLVSTTLGRDLPVTLLNSLWMLSSSSMQLRKAQQIKCSRFLIQITLLQIFKGKDKELKNHQKRLLYRKLSVHYQLKR